MGRPKLPEVDKLKDRILELDDDESETLFEWFSNVRDVREYDARKAAERKAAKGVPEVPKGVTVAPEPPIRPLDERMAGDSR